METKVKKPTPQERKEATAELKSYHMPVFNSLKVSDPAFIPKMAHNVKGLNGLHMGFFKSELEEPRDIFTECVSMQMEPEDPQRTLYRIKHNPFFEEEYATSDPMPNGHVRYYIPLEEMEKVVIEEPEFDFLPDPNTDLPLDQMTMRDVAALLLKAPVSQKEWLNEIINSVNK